MNPYRQLPKIDSLLKWPAFEGCGVRPLTEAARETLEALRQQIKVGEIPPLDEASIAREILRRYEARLRPSLEPVINATGIVLHTNMGRAPLDEELFDEARKIACGYCNLEYDLAAGERGDRSAHCAEAFRRLFGVEDALIVNNNAAAVYLILNTFSAGREAVISRGELVEIGGSFRIPEVMAASGAILREVGATNKTYLADYEAALAPETALLMKVHKSNYHIEGFASEVEMADLTALAKRAGLIDYYDLGSAYATELPWGLERREPSLFQILEEAPSLLSFSGDKLFGAVQAGIILGQRELVAALKANPIYRMFRVDKLTLALLERTALAYLKGEVEAKIPTLALLRRTPEELRRMGRRLQERLPIPSKLLDAESYVGGGAMPGAKIPTVLLALKERAAALERHFRRHRIVGRIERERFVLDLRTVFEKDFGAIVEAAEAWDASDGI